MAKIQKPDEEWRKILTDEQYNVLRKSGTESPFNNKYYMNKETGEYFCAGCGNLLFSSSEKYDSGSGWPSFFAPVDDDRTETIEDNSHGMTRVEVRCLNCGGHLGHVFNDGPEPTGLRYCINSASLEFKKAPVQSRSK
jgi:peptide-methionine (R)-S-oxide reductase